LDSSGFQLCSAAFELGGPGVSALVLLLLEAVEQPRRHFGAVLFVELQSLPDDLFYSRFHGQRVAAAYFPANSFRVATACFSSAAVLKKWGERRMPAFGR
jgi:hypothetical protein